MQAIKRTGVPGTYYVTTTRGFNHIKYFPSDGSDYQLVGSVPTGQYGGPGNPGAPNLRPMGNPDASSDINAAIDAHAAKIMV